MRAIGQTELQEKIFKLLEAGDYQSALKLIERLAVNSSVEALELKTAAYIELGDAQRALAAWEELRELSPGAPYTVFLRARIHLLLSERVRALAIIEELVQSNSTMDTAVAEKAFNLAGQCARFLGRVKEAVRYYSIAAEAAPTVELKALNYSNMLFNSHYLPASPAENLKLARGYDKIWQNVPHFEQRNPNIYPKRRLHIGYISPDIREHVVLSFAYALLTRGDEDIRVTLYSTGNEDAYTCQAKIRADDFRNLKGLLPAAAARVIYEDDVDILVDLAGHTANNVLPILAYKPAPIIISGIGYFASTGLGTVDYFLADNILARGNSQSGFTEKLLPLSASHFCYTPLRKAPPVIPPDFSDDQGLVLGCFNNFSKINERVLAVWQKILTELPTARLFLKTNIFDYEDSKEAALEKIARAGIDLARVRVEGTDADYLARYNEVAVALDTFPYPGGGTTADALYMGVPVVTLTGKNLGERFGESLLTNVGLESLVAHSEAEYIAKTVALAGDRETLLALRQGLRNLMLKSPVMNAQGYQDELKACYKKIWQEYSAHMSTLTYTEGLNLIVAVENYAKAGDAAQAAAGASHILAADFKEVRIYERLALAMLDIEEKDAAALAGEKILKLNPSAYEIIIAAYALEYKKTPAEIIALLEIALERAGELNNDNQGMAYQLLARMMRSLGDTKGEAAYYFKASELKSAATGKLEAFSNALFAMNYSDFPRAEYIAQAHAYGRVLHSLTLWRYQHDIKRHRHAKLRVGYISPDFDLHVVAVFAKAFFAHYDKERFEVYAYSLAAPNRVSESFAKYIGEDKFYYVQGKAPVDIAALIYSDEIDILVDLAGHTGNNPLPIMAYKPAPVQVTGIGYFATTGLDAIDYFLVDEHTSPAGEDKFFTEKLFRLPSSHLCYQNIQLYNTPSAPAPFRKNNYITFGSLSNPTKLNTALLAAWREILASVPGSRLFLKSAGFDNDIKRREILAWANEAGIASERIIIEGKSDEYRSAYYNIDIALDTFPYPGGGTTADALYMGVPVVTFAGNSHHQRFGASMLVNVGLQELVAEDIASYIASAVKLAQDEAKLSYLQDTLRYRFLDSSLGNPSKYMAELEDGYRKMWADYLAPQGITEPAPDYKKLILHYLGENNDDGFSRTKFLATEAISRNALGSEYCYWRAYCEERLGNLPSALELTEKYLADQKTSKDEPVYGEFLKLKAALDFKLARGEAPRSYYEVYSHFAGIDTPNVAGNYSNYLLALHTKDISSDELFKAHLEYDKILARVPRFSHADYQKPTGKRKIRVGYLSADFRRHVMHSVYMTMLTKYDRTRFEVYAYSLTLEQDEVAGAVKKNVDKFVDLAGFHDNLSEAAKLIFEDKLDILFDLGGHSAGGTLTIMAYRPAPIQLSGLGYMATTGLSDIDYFLTDGTVDPAGQSEEFFSEKLIRLSSQFCYTPFRVDLPVSAAAPSAERGWLLFGVFGHYRKFTDEMITAWGAILNALPTAKLLVKSQVLFSPMMCLEAYHRFAGLGVDMTRVIFEPATSDYMERYLDVDIALDTYPWTGGVTTLDALYMGVPVISRYGERRGTRFGLSIIRNIELNGLAVSSVSEYIERAIAVAGDAELMTILHRKLRGMMRNSPLLDGAKYMNELEAAYSEIIDNYSVKR